MSQPRSSRARYRAFLEDYKKRRLDEETEKRDKGASPGTPPATPGKSQGLLRGKRREYLRDYLRWLRPHRARIAWVFLFALIAAGLQMVEPLFMRFIIDRVLLEPGTNVSWRLLWVHLAGTAFLVVIVASNLVGALKDFRQRLLNVRVMLSLRRALFHRLLHLPLPKVWDMKTGGVLSRLTGDVDTTTGLLQLAIVSPAISVIRLLVAIGILFALNWRLALVARRAPEIDAWARTQGFAPGQFAVYSGDVSQTASILAAAESCIATQGQPDVVIANAGISVGMDTRVRGDIEVMARTFATNNVGLAATFHPFVKAMRERGSGTLVGVASVAGIRGLPGHGAYCASKSAVVAYCESLRGECRPFGVRVVTLLPGYIDTPLTRSNRYSMPFLMTADGFAEQAVRAIRAQVSYRVIPWQMGIVAKLMRLLPNWLYDKLLAGRPRKQRQGGD